MLREPRDKPFQHRQPNEKQQDCTRQFLMLFEQLHVAMEKCGLTSREKSEAMTHLEEAALWMDKHIRFRVFLEEP